jgi:hypothetical protein
VSGKGDAKKWKCSIYADTLDGPVVMMDWLAERGLDRKALGLLQANATAHEAYRVRLRFSKLCSIALQGYGQTTCATLFATLASLTSCITTRV